MMTVASTESPSPNSRENAHVWSRIGQAPWPEIGVMFVAAIVRFWRLGYHSVWFDEAVSLKWASSDASYIWEVTFPLVQDKHPPFYYLLLHYWQTLLGPFGLATNDVALRSIGAVLGFLTVAGVLWLAISLGSRATGLLAGLLVGLSPLLVWYSQELRMFQPAATYLVWSTVALMQVWQNHAKLSRFWWWLLFIVTLTASLYTYLFSAFMLPAAGLMVALLALQRRSWRFFFEGVVALGLVTAAFLPLAYNAWIVNSSESTPGVAFAGFVANTTQLIQTFTIWRAPWSQTVKTVAVSVYALLVIIGLALPYPKERDDRRVWRLSLDQAWLLVWLLTPLLVANIMLSRSGSVFKEERYLLFIAPFFLWAVARGAVTLGLRLRVAGYAAAGAAIVPLLLALPFLWTPAMARENWRAAADYIYDYSSTSTLPDAVIAHVDYTHLPLEWYLRKETTFESLPVFFPFGGALQPEDMETVIAPPLNGLVDFGTQTAWLTQSHLEGIDDQRLVEQWFADHYPIVTEHYPSGVKLSGYTLQYRYPILPEMSQYTITPSIELAPGIVLDACEILQPTLSAEDLFMHPPSGWLHARLWWRAVEDGLGDTVTTAKLVGPDGVWGERLLRTGDLSNYWPSSQWVADEYVREEVDVNLNPITPPGEYRLMIGLASEVGGEPLAEMDCGVVTITN